MLININVMFKITYSVNLPTSEKITLNEFHGQIVMWISFLFFNYNFPHIVKAMFMLVWLIKYYYNT